MNIYVKNFILSLLILSTFCCEKTDDKEIQADISNEILNRSICPSGMYLAVSLDWKFDIFEKFDGLTCKGGWGMCFQVGPVWTISCENIKYLAEAKVRFNLVENSGSSVGIINNVDKTCTFYFHKDIMMSSVYQNKDFDSFSIGDDLFIDLSKTKKLVIGSYPKIVEGNFLKYVIPYDEL